MGSIEGKSERSTQVFADLLYSEKDSRHRAIKSIGIAVLGTLFALRNKHTALPIITVVASEAVAFVNQLEAQEKHDAAYSLLRQKARPEEPKSESPVSLEQISGEFALQTSEEFMTDMIPSIEHAKDRVWLEFMQFESGEIMSRLVDTLIAAKERGVDVSLHLDRYAKNFTRVGNRDVWRFSQILRNPTEEISGLDERTLKQRNRFTTEYDIEKLQEAGIVDFPEVSGIQKYIPFVGGGNHRKFVKVDDTAWLGTTELTDSDITSMDNFMFRITSPKLVNILTEIFLNPPQEDVIILPQDSKPGQANLELLVDSGKPNSSIIYQRGLFMIATAQNPIKYVTQYWPEGLLKQALFERARGGLSVTVVLEPDGDHRVWRHPFKLRRQKFIEEAKKAGVNIKYSERSTHAKALVEVGKVALFGSNNLFEPSIIAGTKELSIYTENPELVGLIDDRIFNHSK